MSDRVSHSRVAPAVGLVLLESLRAVDTPPEEEETIEYRDLPTVPRRLGLSSAVEDQIQRWTKLRGRRATLGIAEVTSLIELISRRPDARDVFAEAGRRLARRHLDERRLPRRAAARLLPGRARHRLALRRTKRVARMVSPGSEIRTEARPAAVVLTNCLPADASSGDEGCAFLEGAMEAIFQAYRAHGVEVVHPLCEGRADGRCVWRVHPAGG